MSKLLEEAKENRDKALSEAKKSHGDGERGLYSAWQEAVELIEKHEKPKGLMQYVRPPHYREFPPLEFSTNFWAFKYKVLEHVKSNKKIKEMRRDIKNEFDEFYFSKLNIELTEEQQEIYTELKYAYQFFCRIVPNDKDNAIASIFNILEGTEDCVAIPILKKFISEVEE